MRGLDLPQMKRKGYGLFQPYIEFASVFLVYGYCLWQSGKLS